MKTLSSVLRHKVAALERSQAVIEFSLEGEVLRVNEPFLQLMGYSEAEVVGRPHSMFVPANEIQTSAHEELWNRLRRGESTVGEFCRVNKNGEPIWIHGVYCPLLDDQGRPYRVMKFATDITASKRRDADCAGQIAAIRMSQAIAEFDLDGYLLDANSVFLDIMGYQLDAIKGRHHSLFVHAGERDSVEYRAFWWRLRDGNYHAGLYRRIDARGEPRWIQATYNPVRDENGRLTKVVKFATDQTSAVADRLRVEYLYRHDTLTGLANRVGLQLVLQAAFVSQVDAPAPTMLLIDLDCFKYINDTFGHPAGDHCLTVIAGRLKVAAKEALIVARLGGDEFAIVLSDATEAEALAEKIVAAVSEPFEWKGEAHRVGASIGISTGCGTPSELLRTADLALYAAKGAGRGTSRTYASVGLGPTLQPSPGLSVSYPPIVVSSGG